MINEKLIKAQKRALDAQEELIQALLSLNQDLKQQLPTALKTTRKRSYHLKIIR